MKNKTLNQQGDILLKPVRMVPKGAKKLKHLVLAEGEHTGHKHQIVCEPREAELYETMDKDMFLRCFSPVSLVHEEHATQFLEPGTYKIEIVREYDYLSGMVRPVQD